MTLENWRHGIFYQIYPRSFRDTTGNGIGDLQGIINKLDYVADLGVDGIWISPFFKSPQADYGYDVSDYQDIDPMFGTMADFDALLAKATKLNLPIMVDLVLSHTSVEHPWFSDPAKKDWYVWADAKIDENGNRQPPNNWVSIFGGSAWEWHEGHQQYYMHNFLVEQPDLNFHNPAVQQQALDTAKFWLDKGIGGFRLDAINFCFHDQSLKDNPPRPPQLGAASQFEGSDPYSEQQHLYDKSQPEMLPFLQKFRALMDQYPGTFTIGEIGDDNPYTMAAQYTAGGDKLHTTYNPQMMAGKTKDLTEDLIRIPIETFHAHAQIMPRPAGHPAWAFSNHDVVRSASRWLPDSDGFSHNPKLSKMLITLLACLPGTLFLYQGEELGLPEAKLTFDQLQDPWGKHLWPEWQGRDGSRTPMPWSNTTPDGWLPVPDSHRALNIEDQHKDKHSVLNHTRKTLAWRKKQPALLDDDIRFLHTQNPKLLEFTRFAPDQTLHCHFDLNTYDYKITEI